MHNWMIYFRNLLNWNRSFDVDSLTEINPGDGTCFFYFSHKVKNFGLKFFGAIGGIIRTILSFWIGLIGRMVIATGRCKNFLSKNAGNYHLRPVSNFQSLFVLIELFTSWYFPDLWGSKVFGYASSYIPFLFSIVFWPTPETFLCKLYRSRMSQFYAIHRHFQPYLSTSFQRL